MNKSEGKEKKYERRKEKNEKILDKERNEMKEKI